MKKILLIFFATLLLFSLHAHEIKGKVYGKTDNKRETLPGANVVWANTQIGATTDKNGAFEIHHPDSFPAILVVSYVGYTTDSIRLDKMPDKALEITLIYGSTLQDVEINERESSKSISLIDPLYIEKITSKELKKAACCNLSESFETNATVDLAYTDAISGARKIQMLGLDGIYTQILFENLLFIRGLASNLGLGYIPGTWVESIQVSKGAGSVVNGYESMAGQINIELIKPGCSTDKLFVNGYANNMGRYEANVHSLHKISEKWSTLFLVHGNTLVNDNDKNKDGFLDMPLKRNGTFMNRWQYEGKKLETRFGIRYLNEELQSGQVGYNHQSDFGNSMRFGVGINTEQVELFSKTGFFLPGNDHHSIALTSIGRIHKQNAYFGNRLYNGVQQSLNTSVIYQTEFVEHHLLKAGASYLFDNYNEQFTGTDYLRTERVPGLFAEYAFNSHKRFSMVAGIRSDFHNMFGTQITPRLHLKYNPAINTAIRFSGGRGFRTANIFAENAGVFASARQVIIHGPFQPEISWNSGVSVTHKFRLFNNDASFNTDFFRTEFQNQVVVDIETPREIAFYNLSGKSYSNSFQAELDVEPLKGFHVRLAGKYTDVKVTYNKELKQKPLVPYYRSLLNLAYYTKNDKWTFDYTVKYFGAMRIPEVNHAFTNELASRQSNSYFIMNCNVSRKIKRWEVYLGIENMTQYMQHNPILHHENPFSPDFDASLIWAPMNARVIYTGFRYTL
jgi:outer membrane receptor for ferrienterochelin and colicins